MLAVPPALSAQIVVPEVGEEVRVVQRNAQGAVHGLYVAATSAEILLSSIEGGGPIRIARDDISGMSVRRGHRSQALRGALFGIGAGVAAGIIIGQKSTLFDNTGQAVGVSVGAALPLGLIIGWFVRSPEWDGVDMAALATSPEVRSSRYPRAPDR